MDDVLATDPRARTSEIVGLYRRMLRRCRRIEALSGDAVGALRIGSEVRLVAAALERKRVLLREIRREEDSMNEAREWWKRSFATLPSSTCRQLLALQEAIGETLESAMAHEDECRALLKERIAWTPGSNAMGDGS